MNELSENQHILADVIEKSVVTPLRKGQCGLSKEEIYTLCRLTCHVEKNISEVCELTGWSPRTLERRYIYGDFPKPHKTPSNKPLWWLDEIEIYMAERGLKVKT